MITTKTSYFSDVTNEKYEDYGDAVMAEKEAEARLKQKEEKEEKEEREMVGVKEADAVARFMEVQTYFNIYDKFEDQLSEDGKEALKKDSFDCADRFREDFGDEVFTALLEVYFIGEINSIILNSQL